MPGDSIADPKKEHLNGCSFFYAITLKDNKKHTIYYYSPCHINNNSYLCKKYGTMIAITLQDLKERKLNPKTADRMERTWELNDHNKMVYRYRMEKGDIDSCTFDMTHNGNDPKSNEQMLDDARCYYEQRVYTDEEWEQYFIPAINEMIAYNDSFVRWMPGYVIKNKRTGDCCIVEYDYALGFGGRDYTSLSVVDIDSEGNPCCSWAWAHYDNYDLIDSEHTEENIAKVLAYHKSRGHNVPYSLSQKLSQMLYEKDTREAPARR